MIKLMRLSSGYPGKAVLSQVDAHIPSGKITILVGPNGCGKSTLLKTICGILPIRSGEILLDGRSITDYSSKALACQISYLAQSRQLPDITVERMVLHGRFPHLSYPRRYRPQDFQIARAAMERMGILDLASHSLSALSGGTRQKVYIAMALAQDTPTILLDEPTTYLDISHQLQMMEHARALCREGRTVVMVLHDLSMALQVADQLILMDQGQIIQQGTPEEIFAAKQLEAVFDVRFDRVQTKNGWHYYYETGGAPQ